MSKSLFDLLHEKLAIHEESVQFEDAEADTDEEAERVLIAWMEQHDLDLQDKVDAYGAVIRDFKDKANVAKAEVARVRERQRVFDARVDRMKRALRSYLETTGTPKIETALTTVAIRKKGGKAPLVLSEDVAENPLLLPTNFWKVTPDTAEIRRALESGDEDVFEYAHLGERGSYLYIK